MADFLNRSFENETVIVDGNTFQGCRFENCTFIYRGGTFTFRDECSFGLIVHRLEDCADHTATYMRFFKMKPEEPEQPLEEM